MQGAKTKPKEKWLYTLLKVRTSTDLANVLLLQDILKHFISNCPLPPPNLWIETALAVPPLLAAMGYEPTNGGWKLRADAPNFY
jgi:hypothetical protein